MGCNRWRLISIASDTTVLYPTPGFATVFVQALDYSLAAVRRTISPGTMVVVAGGISGIEGACTSYLVTYSDERAGNTPTPPHTLHVCLYCDRPPSQHEPSVCI